MTSKTSPDTGFPFATVSGFLTALLAAVYFGFELAGPGGAVIGVALFILTMLCLLHWLTSSESFNPPQPGE